MKESLSQTQQQRLHQTLSPQQVQYVKVLEMTGPEVEDEVRRELDDNPALEISPDEAVVSGDGDFNESAEELQMADYGSDDDIPSYRLATGNYSDDRKYYEPEAVEGGGTLLDYLTAQIDQMRLSPRERELAILVAGNLDDNGYLRRSLSALANDAMLQTGLDITTDEVDRMWRIVRTLDPAGVGAADLRDCLLLQLRRKPEDETTADAIELVGHYFDLFSKGKLEQTRKAMGISSERYEKAIELIRSLNPKPGGAVGNSSSLADDSRMSHITPDFIVEVDGDRLILTMPNRLPALQIEESFSGDISVTPRNRRDEEAAAFIRQKRDEAEGFIKALSMRRDTLRRVMTAIMKLQREFFLTDDETRLKPMILKDVAELTGNDISVVSRAASGKYVATGRGIYPLKFFFNERTNEDEDVSARKIVGEIRNIIDNEPRNAPLSDDTITEMLRAKGYNIARRTVAKYREKAGIPIARLRHLSK